jgi:hypothetical protein
MKILSMDEYDRKARLRPALFAALPLTLLVAAFNSDGIVGWSGTLALLTQAGVGYFLAQFAGDLGKKKEAGLFRRFGGRPTEIALRHAGNDNPPLLAVRHAKLKKLFPELKIPSAAAEGKDPTVSHQAYEACVSMMRTRFRSQEPVFRELVNYGSRRNAWGLKWIGLGLSTLGSLVLAGELYGQAILHHKIATIQLIALCIEAGLVCVWTVAITAKWVMRAARLYSDRLMEALDATS